MITNRAKEEACGALEAYLKLIYHFGKGVMLVVHIQRYMEHLDGKNKTSVWRDLRELQSKEIIDVHKIHNNSYIKLKKYALRYLLNKSSAKDTKSVKYGFATIKKSLFINELILQYPLRGSNIEELIDYYSSNTTFINKDKQNTAMLSNLLEKFNSLELKREIENLSDIYIQQMKRLQSKAQVIGVKKRNGFNLNNMQSRNIYISSIKENTINVVFLDINDSYTARKMAENFQCVYEYLRIIFPENMRLKFTVIVSDEENEMKIQKQIPKLNQCLKDKQIDNCFKIRIKNLDLRAKLFSNVKILL